jgi:SAM-dependent methyltransferase
MALLIGTETPDLTKVDSDKLAQVGKRLCQGLQPGGPAAYRVFQGWEVPQSELQAFLSSEDLRSLERCGILQTYRQSYRCPFYAHRIEECLIFTDPPGPIEPQAPAYLDPLWQSPMLVPLLIRGAVRSALDMGCGSGVLALVMASYATEAVGVDPNPRAIAMSRLNAALNAIRNVTFLEGDLFKPVQSYRFDRVVFNSPTDKEGDQYIDLLHAGEGILQRFFSELPAFLTDTGCAQVNLGMNDYPDSPFRDRLRTWLGSSAERYQVLLLVGKQASLESGRQWKRGWLTLRHGPWRFREIPYEYHRLPAGTTSDQAAAAFRRFLAFEE